MTRTPEQILQQTNQLAREFAQILGYEILNPNLNFWEGTHPRLQMCWKMARAAQITLTDTDPEDAIVELD